MVHGCGGAKSVYDTELDNSFMLLSGCATVAVFDGGGFAARAAFGGGGFAAGMAFGGTNFTTVDKRAFIETRIRIVGMRRGRLQSR